MLRTGLVVASALAAFGLSACATMARTTLLDRFEAIGIPAETSRCMVDEIDRRLSDEDLEYLARFTLRVARADSTFAAVRELMRIDNPRAVTAIGASALDCVTGFRL